MIKLEAGWTNPEPFSSGEIWGEKEFMVKKRTEEWDPGITEIEFIPADAPEEICGKQFPWSILSRLYKKTTK